MHQVRFQLPTLKEKQTGAVSIIFAFSLVAILSLIMLSMNTALLTMQKERLQQAVESSVIAIGLAGEGLAGNKLTPSDYNQIVIRVFAAFFPDNYQDIIFKILAPEKVEDPYTLDADFSFKLFANRWLSSIKVNDASQIKLESKIGVDVIQGNIEVALVMDNSGSMSQDIDSLRSSATLFVEQLFSGQATSDQVYISIIPFATKVNVGSQNLSWMESNLGADALNYGACTNFRYPLPTTATIAQQVISNTLVTPITKKFPGVAAGPVSFCSGTSLLGLSNNKQVLINKINSMAASGTTDGDQGILWGWRTLAEEWQGLWLTEPSRPLKSSEVKKVMLFFSDGAAISNEIEVFQPACEAIKAAGIELYTIQFSVTNNSMQTCASNTQGKQYYFYANSQQQLKQAFSDISASVGFELKLKKL